MIKLLIVDDSALMRKQLVNIFNDQDDVEISACRNGVEALQELHEYKPHVITLDINMPEMDGLTCLSKIMNERPTPVIMVSSLTQRGAMATYEALAMGAVDFIAKPDGTMSQKMELVGRELIAKVRSAATSRVRAHIKQKPPVRCGVKTVRNKQARHTGAVGVVLIGVSTGGPGTLQEILPLLPQEFPWPIVVAQHMPSTFTKSFSERLDTMCNLSVREVISPTQLEPGNIYIAKGDADIVLGRRPSGVTAGCKPMSSQYNWHPSVELMVTSAMQCYEPADIIAVQLTGMGDDGAKPMAQLHELGGRTIAESEETAIVFGMPKELIARNGATSVLPAGRIAAQLENWTA